MDKTSLYILLLTERAKCKQEISLKKDSRLRLNGSDTVVLNLYYLWGHANALFYFLGEHI